MLKETPAKIIADPRLREDDEKGCGVLGAEPLGEGVGKDLPLKIAGMKSMDPVAALQNDAGQGRRCPLKAGMTWWGKALPRGRLPPPR